MFIVLGINRRISLSSRRIFFLKCFSVSGVHRHSDSPFISPPSADGSASEISNQDRHLCIQPSKVPLGLDEKEAARRIRHIISRIRDGTVEDVIKQLELDCGCSEIQISSSLVESMLSGFGDDWKSAMGFFQFAASCSGYKHTSRSYTKMVDMLGKMKQFKRMMELIDKMREDDLLSIDTLAKAMRRFTGGGKRNEAIKIFNELEYYGLMKNTEAMNILLDTLSKERYIETAREIFAELKSRIAPDAYTFNIFVHGWCRINRMEEAEWTVLEMKGYGFYPSVITYSTMIEAYCKNCRTDRVFELLDKMHAEGCIPNIVTYTVAMHSLAKIHGYDAAMKIVNMMDASGCKPDRIFYNSMIYVLGRAGRLTEASRVFESAMSMNDVAPDLSTYNTMISLFCHHSRKEEALEVYKKMENASCLPDLLTFTPLLKLCFKRENAIDLLSFLMNEMVNEHLLSLDLSMYSLLIHGLCKVGRTDWAFLLFEEMVHQEIVPRKQTWKLLLKEAEGKMEHATVERIKDLVKKIHASPL